jgi:hypothetical protein
MNIMYHFLIPYAEYASAAEIAAVMVDMSSLPQSSKSFINDKYPELRITRSFFSALVMSLQKSFESSRQLVITLTLPSIAE